MHGVTMKNEVYDIMTSGAMIYYFHQTNDSEIGAV